MSFARRTAAKAHIAHKPSNAFTYRDRWKGCVPAAVQPKEVLFECELVFLDGVAVDDIVWAAMLERVSLHLPSKYAK